MVETFVRLHLWLARHRAPVLFVTALGIVAAIYLASRLNIDDDFTAMLPMSNPAIAEQVDAFRHVRQADRLFVDVETTAVEPARLAEAADRMAEALRGIPGLGDVRDTVDATAWKDVYAELQRQLPELLSAEALRGAEVRWGTNALEARLTWLKKALAQPQGMVLKEVAASDPVGLGDVVSERLRSLQAGLSDVRIVEGRLTSLDGRHVLMSAAPEFRSSEVGKSAPLIERVLAAAREVERGFPGGAVRVSITGAHRTSLDNAQMIRRDTAVTSGMSMLLIALLVMFTFRRRWLAPLSLLPTALGALGAMVAMHAVADTVSAVALGCGSILAGVTVDYGSYVLYESDDAPKGDRRAFGRAVGQLIPAILFGSLTSSVAFLVMLMSPVAGHRHLGAFGAMGVMLAALLTILLLPLLVPVGGAPASAKADPRLPLTAFMDRLFVWRSRNWRRILPALVLLTLASVVGLARLRFDGDLNRLNGVKRETRQEEESIRAIWGKALSLTLVVVEGRDTEEVLVKNEKVHAALVALFAKGEVEGFSSIAPLVPSMATRREHRRAWDAYWTEDRVSQLGGNLAVAARRLGFRDNAFQSFLDRLRAAPSSETLAWRPSEALAPLVADYWKDEGGRIYLNTPVKIANTAGLSRVREAIRSAVPDARLANRSAMAEELSRVASRALPTFALLTLALNAVLLFVLLGRVVLVGITLLPLLAGIVWTLGIQGLMGIPIDMANFIFVVFVIGVGGDYALFLVLAALEPLRGKEERAASTGGAVTLCALTTLVGVGVLILARHPALFSVGFTAVLGITFSLGATLFLVPTCMEALARRHGVADAGTGDRRARIRRLYWYQAPWVTQFVYWKTRSDPMFRVMDGLLPDGGRILDLGCGYGVVAQWLTLDHPNRTVIGMDLDASKVEVARASAKANPRLAFEECDLLGRPKFPESDAVLLFDVLHYFTRASKLEVLRAVRRCVAPGGRVLVRDACRSGSRAHWVTALLEKFAVLTGQHRTRQGLHFESEHGYRELFREAGFGAVQVEADSGLGSNRLFIVTAETTTDEAAPKLRD
ncbi:MAG: MMPL family transporter [Verrucomicrobiales bacterium]|nr:MMPL family transporter [Verrucomicrobiales bacterium]